MSSGGWTEPIFTLREVDRAGRALVPAQARPHDYIDALDVVDNWRAAHAFPLNTFQVGLRQRARRVDPASIVAQRLKRLSSIELKLVRFPTMQLSAMQDIGGCRAIVHSVAQVRRLHELYVKSSLKHAAVRTKDYIAAPKDSGYRSLHLVYRYYSDKKPTFNGLQVEIQLRTQLQHAWATAVETVGTFLDQSLKSSQGSADWLRFFELIGSAFALKEQMPLVPNTPSDRPELVGEIRHYAQRLEVQRTLREYQKVVERHIIPRLREAGFYLLVLRPSERSASVEKFTRPQLEQATERYLQVEKLIQSEAGSQAVLVAAESVEALLKAYPNYFLDTTIFLEELGTVLQRPRGAAT